MKIRLQDGLPFVQVLLTYQENEAIIDNVLLDTGSAGTIFSADRVLEIGLTYEPDDPIHRIRGVGGTEFVYSKQVQQLSIHGLNAENFEVEVGAMDYGFEIDGIIGTDFLTQVGAIIDLSTMQIYADTYK